MTRPNSVVTNYGYDNLSRLTSVLHQLSGSTIDGASYTLDSAGNRTAKVDQLAAVTSNYTYDAIYQLTQATQGGSTTESYSYDPVGNRTASLGVSSYTTNASNEMTANSNASYTYDSNGNTLTKVISSNTTTYAWDYENRLTSVTLPSSGGTVAFKYDPFGRRIYKSVSTGGTSVFAYDVDNLIEETNSSGTVVARYSQTEKIDQPLVMLRSGTASYYEADGLGSVTSLTNSSGALAETYTYDSFGIQTASSGSLTNSSQYTGREMDAETGLYYYRARYFDPIFGRFLSQDPIGIRGGINFYRYADNQPSNQNDPSGLAPQKFGKQVSPPTEGFPFLPNGGFFWYGNWGGPGWTGGQLLPYEDLTPDQRAHLAPPIDEQDACYMGHDLCYSRVRVSYSCKDMSPSQRNSGENRAEGGCDIELYYCLKSVSKQNFFSRFAQPVFSILELLK